MFYEFNIVKMKNVILRSILALAVVIIAAVNLGIDFKNENISINSLSNIEALAQSQEIVKFKLSYTGSYKWIPVSYTGQITKIPCCKKVTEPHSACIDGLDDC